MDNNLFSVKEIIIPNALHKLKELCDQSLKTAFEIEKKEYELKERKRVLERLLRDSIPTLLNEYGLSEIRLATGEKIIIQDKLKASITEYNKELVYKNMYNLEGGDKTDSLFKLQMIIEDSLEDTAQLLLEKGIPYAYKRSIHYQTLNKYCKEKLGQGEKIPEGISVFEYQEAKIKK